MYNRADMTTMLDEAVAWLKTLPDDDQDRAARALLAFAAERSGAEPDDDAFGDTDNYNKESGPA